MIVLAGLVMMMTAPIPYGVTALGEQFLFHHPRSGAFSRDGTTAYVTSGSEVLSGRIHGKSHHERVFEPAGVAGPLTEGPHGRTAYSAGHRLYEISPRGRPRRVSSLAFAQPVEQITSLRGGRLLVFGRGIWIMRPGGAHRRIARRYDDYWSYDPQGRLIITTDGQKRWRSIDLSGHQRKLIPPSTDVTDFDAHSGLIAWRDSNWNLGLYDVGLHKNRWVVKFEPCVYLGCGPRLMPRDHAIAAVIEDGIGFYDIDTGKQFALAVPDNGVTFMSYSERRRLLLAAEVPGGVWVYRLDARIRTGSRTRRPSSMDGPGRGQG